jgi:hypothetical protein
MNKLNRSFKTGSTLEEANEIVTILAEHQIPSKVTEDTGDLDASLLGESPLKKFEVYINENDLIKAESVYVKIAEEDIDSIDLDYYLFQFTNEELLDLLVNKNEWSELDVILSRKILLNRGVKIDESELEQKQLERKEELSKPEGGQLGWLIFGYISIPFGGFIGLVVGYFIWQAKNKLPSGEKVPAYSEKVRMHGKIIFLISVIVFPLIFILRVYTEIIQFSSW